MTEKNHENDNLIKFPNKQSEKQEKDIPPFLESIFSVFTCSHDCYDKSYTSVLDNLGLKHNGFVRLFLAGCHSIISILLLLLFLLIFLLVKTLLKLKQFLLMFLEHIKNGIHVLLLSLKNILLSSKNKTS